MSFTPDPFQHYQQHTRQPSLPTVYEDNDPYRIVKKSPNIDSSDFDTVHSRTASDSSTTRLLHTLPPLNTTIDFNDDPYKKKKVIKDDRANSYLPYSHHKRDPNQVNEPIYIEEYTTASTSLGIGSMLHDNMTDQINNNNSRKSTTTHQISNVEDKIVNLSFEMKKKNRKNKTCFGLKYRTVILIVLLFFAIIGVIIYFVWPRIPSMILMDVDNIGTIQIPKNTTKKSYSTTWQLNMTVNNNENWFTTRISSIDFILTDNETNNKFGNGTIGSLSLPPRRQSELKVLMTIDSGQDDIIFQNLYDACGVQVSSTMPFDVKQDRLNITLHITYHIFGIAWPSTRLLPVDNLRCPTS